MFSTRFMTCRLGVRAALAAFAMIAAGASVPFASMGLVHAAGVEEREPSADAKPHTVFTWKSKGELRYQWCLPEAYDPNEPRDLIVLLHGTGLDYRWGFANHRAGDFRPDDIVVSVDGTSPGQGESRLFLGKSADAKAFRAFLDEMRDVFAVRDVYLYGHSQGGFFVGYFAGAYPETVKGVVAHASGVWNHSKRKGAAQRVAVVYQHGTADPVVPYVQSRSARDLYVESGFDAVHLRRLILYNHWPNAVRTSESIDWCVGMSTDDPERAFHAAVAQLRPKAADQYRWSTVVGFAGARQVLRRFESNGIRPFRDVDEDLLDRVGRLVKAIDEHAERHVKLLRRQVQSSADLKLDGKPWLGHLVSLREDFRGIDPVEEYVESIGLDRALEKQSKAAARIRDAYYSKKDPEAIVDAIAEHLPDAVLYEGFPTGLEKRVRDEINELKRPTKKSRAAEKYLEGWSRSWEEGLEQYEKTWRGWKLPAGMR